nr:hypothetical protein [Streptomyces sp. SID4982]
MTTKTSDCYGSFVAARVGGDLAARPVVLMSTQGMAVAKIAEVPLPALTGPET